MKEKKEKNIKGMKNLVFISAISSFVLIGLLGEYLLSARWLIRLPEIIILIALYLWLTLDADEKRVEINDLTKSLMVMTVIPLIIYIFKTRKIKKGIMLTFKMIGAGLVMYLGMVVPAFAVSFLRGLGEY